MSAYRRAHVQCTEKVMNRGGECEQLSMHMYRLQNKVVKRRGECELR